MKLLILVTQRSETHFCKGNTVTWSALASVKGFLNPMPTRHTCLHLLVCISSTGRGEQDCSQHRQVLQSSPLSEIVLALFFPARLSRLIQVKPTKVPCTSSPTELWVSFISVSSYSRSYQPTQQSQVWCMSEISGLGKWRQGDHELKVSLSYSVSLRPAWATQDLV